MSLEYKDHRFWFGTFKETIHPLFTKGLLMRSRFLKEKARQRQSRVLQVKLRLPKVDVWVSRGKYRQLTMEEYIKEFCHLNGLKES